MADEFIPLSSVNIGKDEISYVTDAIQTGWISSTGKYVAEFESALAKVTGRSHALAVTNGTVALEVVLRAMGIGPGDEVIVPALTFVAPAAAVAAVGALPVFADVTEESWTIDVNDVAKQITSKTKAIIAVDLLGHPCDYDSLTVVAGSIPIIEDAAQAHGAVYKGKPVGSLGFASTFSFHANKAIATGEGGAVLTDSKDLFDKLWLYSNHGMTKEKPYYHEIVGHNFRMTNLTAAVGVGQVMRWYELTSARNRVAGLYDKYLSNVTGLYRRPVAAWAEESCWLYAVGISGGKKEAVLNAFRTARVDSRAIWTALPDLEIYRKSVRGDYPIARRLSREVIWLPTSAVMTDVQVNYVSEILSEAL